MSAGLQNQYLRVRFSPPLPCAPVDGMADTLVLETNALGRPGSSPGRRTRV